MFYQTEDQSLFREEGRVVGSNTSENTCEMRMYIDRQTDRYRYVNIDRYMKSNMTDHACPVGF